MANLTIGVSGNRELGPETSLAELRTPTNMGQMLEFQGGDGQVVISNQPCFPEPFSGVLPLQNMGYGFVLPELQPLPDFSWVQNLGNLPSLPAFALPLPPAQPVSSTPAQEPVALLQFSQPSQVDGLAKETGSASAGQGGDNPSPVFFEKQAQVHVLGLNNNNNWDSSERVRAEVEQAEENPKDHASSTSTRRPRTPASSPGSDEVQQKRLHREVDHGQPAAAAAPQPPHIFIEGGEEEVQPPAYESSEATPRGGSQNQGFEDPWGQFLQSNRDLQWTVQHLTFRVLALEKANEEWVLQQQQQQPPAVDIHLMEHMAARIEETARADCLHIFELFEKKCEAQVQISVQKIDAQALELFVGQEKSFEEKLAQQFSSSRDQFLALRQEFLRILDSLPQEIFKQVQNQVAALPIKDLVLENFQRFAENFKAAQPAQGGEAETLQELAVVAAKIIEVQADLVSLRSTVQGQAQQLQQFADYVRQLGEQNSAMNTALHGFGGGIQKLHQNISDE
eukprot:EG_transcript_7837